MTERRREGEKERRREGEKERGIHTRVDARVTVVVDGAVENREPKLRLGYQSTLDAVIKQETYKQKTTY